MTQRLSTIITAFMMVTQGVLPSAGWCACTTGVSQETEEAATSCCDAVSSSNCGDCGTSECDCGENCGQEKSACDCGCGSEQQPGQSPEPDRPTETQLKILIRGLTALTTSLSSQSDKALIRSKSEFAGERAQSVQVLNCKWQT